MNLISEKSIGIDGQMSVERRGGIRRRVLKGAVLVFNQGFSTFEGTLRNQSEHGAKLTFGETLAIPPSFELRVAGEEMPRMARIRWRSTTAVGVEFD